MRLTPTPVPLSRNPAGKEDGAHVQQIDEVGVPTQMSIQCHRLGEDLAAAIDGGGGWQYQHIDAVPQLFGEARVILERVEPRKASTAEMPLPAWTMARTTGWMAVGFDSSSVSNAAVRSATQGPP